MIIDIEQNLNRAAFEHGLGLYKHMRYEDYPPYVKQYLAEKGRRPMAQQAWVCGSYIKTAFVALRDAKFEAFKGVKPMSDYRSTRKFAMDEVKRCVTWAIKAGVIQEPVRNTIHF